MRDYAVWEQSYLQLTCISRRYGKVLLYFLIEYERFSFQGDEGFMFANCSVLIVNDDSFARG
jgi:hypothetical protein